jgi:hypothetical protein
VHVVVARGLVVAVARTARARFSASRSSVRYVDAKARLRFASTKVTSVLVRGHTATLRGVGVRNGKRGVAFRLVLVAGTPGTMRFTLGRYVNGGRVVNGSVVVR